MEEPKTRDTKFIATQTFTCEETGNVYVEGMSYRIRRKNDVLRARVTKWLSESKVEIVPSEGARATIVKGNGEVK